jgi:hypothetical protein
VDLGAESLDLLEITLESEEHFHIAFPEKNILETATEVLGEGVLQHEGRLTDEGIRLLQARMPELDAAWVDELPGEALKKQFLRVDVWVRLIHDLVLQSPRTCLQCAADLRPGSPGRLKCVSCHLEVDIPRGDDLNKRWVEQYCATRPQPSPAATVWTEAGAQPLISN